MALGFNGSNQYVTANTLVNALVPPFTLYGRFYISNTIASQGLLCVTDGLKPTDRQILIARGATAGDPIQVASVVNDGINSGEANTTIGYSANTWHSVSGVNSTTTSRTITIDATGANTNSTNVPLSNINKIGIGAAFADGAWVAPLTGRAAEVAIWAAALSDAEIASLAKGFTPRRIRPQSLVFYAPLIRAIVDIKGGLALTPVNSPSVADHPRVYP